MIATLGSACSDDGVIQRLPPEFPQIDAITAPLEILWRCAPQDKRFA